jgi:hypothetical protein
MVSNAPVVIAKDAIIHAKQLARLDDQASLFQNFASRRLAQSLAQL